MVIVLVFPVTSVLEYYWIKSIVDNLKKSFLDDLIKESKSFQKKQCAQKSDNPVIAKLVISTYAEQIFTSNDYPVTSKWNTIFAFCMSGLNLVTSIITILQSEINFPTYFLQIF